MVLEQKCTRCFIVKKRLETPTYFIQNITKLHRGHGYQILSTPPSVFFHLVNLRLKVEM